MTVLVAYATKSGSTEEVAEVVAAMLAGQGLRVETKPAAEVAELDGYDAVVLGAALYMGRVHRDAKAFLRRHRGTLATLPFAAFAMGPVSLEEDQVAGSRKQLDRALAAVPEIEPLSVAIFGGVLEPATHRFPFSRMTASDARDWDAIHAWATDLVVKLSGAPLERRSAVPAAAAASSR